MPRHLLILENEANGARTAHTHMRGVRLQAAKESIASGKVWRATLSEALSQSELYAALYNGGGLDEWTLINLVQKGRIKKLRPPEP